MDRLYPALVLALALAPTGCTIGLGDIDGTPIETPPHTTSTAQPTTPDRSGAEGETRPDVGAADTEREALVGHARDKAFITHPDPASTAEPFVAPAGASGAPRAVAPGVGGTEWILSRLGIASDTPHGD